MNSCHFPVEAPAQGRLIAFLQLVRFRCWRGLQTARRYLGLLFAWLTPQFWVFRRNRAPCVQLASSLLPPPYDPVAIELPFRQDRQAKLPHDNNTQAFDGIHEKLAAAALERRFAAIGAAEIGLGAVHDVAAGFAAIDSDLYAALSHLRGSQIASLSDLSNTLSNYNDASWTGSFPSDVGGSLTNIHGHVGEFVLKRYFEDSGLEVAMPGQANNPGWDLLVDGHALDVKAAAKDALSSSISSHFAANPDIPVILSADAAHLPLDAIHFSHQTATGLEPLLHALDSGNGTHQVFVDDALSYASLHDHVQLGTSAAMGGPDVFHHHFPVVTLALSGYKELSLLLDAKTDPVTALKHTALDLSGTGVGGFAGAKAGALVGCIFGPIGAAIGGVVGGIGGAMAGRSYTNEIKRQAFNSAVAEYEIVSTRLRADVAAAEAASRAKLQRSRAEIERPLLQLAKQARNDFDAQLSRVGRMNTDSALIARGDASNAALADGLQEVEALLLELQLRYRTRRWSQRYLWPDVEVIGEAKAIAFLTRARTELAELVFRTERGDGVGRSEVLTALGSTGTAAAAVHRYLADVYAEKREGEQILNSVGVQWLRRLASERAAAAARLQREFDEAVTKIKRKLKPKLRKVKESRELVLTEANKLGLAV